MLKRPKKRLVKADPVRRAAFVREYAALAAGALRTEAKIFFADEAHFPADADLRGQWALKGEPALVDSTSPRRGEKASYYSAVCLETGEVEVMELEGNSNSASSVGFLRQLRARHIEPLTVIWDNAAAHRGDALRTYLDTPGLRLRLVNPVSSTGQALPSYSPDFNAAEAIWASARDEVTANRCLGTRAAVRQKVGGFFARLPSRQEEVKRRCRTVLQVKADEFISNTPADFLRPANVDLTLASVSFLERLRCYPQQFAIDQLIVVTHGDGTTPNLAWRLGKLGNYTYAFYRLSQLLVLPFHIHSPGAIVGVFGHLPSIHDPVAANLRCVENPDHLVHHSVFHPAAKDGLELDALGGVDLAAGRDPFLVVRVQIQDAADPGVNHRPTAAITTQLSSA